VPDNIVDRLARGVALEDGPAKFEKIERINASGSHSWFQVMLTEGRNREVRRLWESQGYQVSRLKRVRYGDDHPAPPAQARPLRGDGSRAGREAAPALRLEHAAPVLTLQPVIGQRRSRPVEIRVGKEHAKESFVNGHVNEEARELRRFDHVREERPRGRGRPVPRPARRQAGARAAGRRRGRPGGPRRQFRQPHRRPAAARPWHGDRPFVPRGAKTGERPFNDRPRPQASATSAARAAPRVVPAAPALPASPGWPSPGRPPHGQGPATAMVRGNPAEFRSWYVPEGVETGSKVAPPRGQRHGAPKPYQQPRPGVPMARTARARQSVQAAGQPRPTRSRWPGRQSRSLGSPAGRPRAAIADRTRMPRGPRGPGGPGGNKPPFRKRPGRLALRRLSLKKRRPGSPARPA
jgi:23S rRNA pseudouridine2605 synthase